MGVAPESGKIGFLGATAIGIGGMVGGGIFAVLGEAATLARGSTWIAFGVAGLVALGTCYSYAKLTVRFPSQGGTVVFVDRAFGVNLLTGTLNVFLWLSYLVTISLYASAFGSYGLTLLPDGQPDWMRHAMISAGILLPVVINLVDAAFVSRSETAVVVIKIALLLLVIASGAGSIDDARLATSTWVSPTHIVAAGMVIFVAYEGFELIANAAKDVRDPDRTLPRAYFTSVLLVIALYLVIAVVVVGTLDPAAIEASEDYALAAAARPALGQAGFVIVAVSALLATFSAINATIYGNARLGFRLAIERELPEVLDRRVRDNPLPGVVTVGVLSLLLANGIDLQAIAILGSAGFLIVFTITNVAAARLAGDTGGKSWLSALAALASGTATAVLLVHTAQERPEALAVLAGFLAFSFLFEWVYPRWAGVPLHLFGTRKETEVS
jgi:amino acid transporter